MIAARNSGSAGSSASSAARLIVVAKRCRCAGVIANPMWCWSIDSYPPCRSVYVSGPPSTSAHQSATWARWCSDTPPGKKPDKASSASTRS